MGAFNSRGNHGVEEVDITSSNAYRYPPKSGCYFGSHFIMGGERFETTQPEAYLFGENSDLNFLGNRPVPFPYPAPQAHEPTKTLKSLVNIRKESLKFVRPDESASLVSDSPTHEVTEPLAEDDTKSISSRKEKDLSSGDKKRKNSQPSSPTESNKSKKKQNPADSDDQKFNIEFTFDTDVKCAVTVFYFATEEISNKQAIYRPRDAFMNSETFHYKRGANQIFSQSTHFVQPGKFSEEEWQYNPDKEVIPIVIQCVVEEDEYIGHSHMTFATVEKVDGGYVLKALKQKQMVDGLCYLLQEIYGIENKNIDSPKDDDLEDTSSECVICLVEMRDTLILPCRHLCLCNCCADNLRYQASNCPICRSPFRALLQIRAMRKKLSQIPLTANSQTTPDTSEYTSPSQEGIPHGYEAISLIEALNGNTQPPSGGGSANSPAGYPDATNHIRRKSTASSPGHSPLVNRRRIRRKPSSGSNRSRHSIRGQSSVEEGDADQGSVDDPSSLSTIPDVVMADVGTNTSHSPIKSKKKSKNKYSDSKCSTKHETVDGQRYIDRVDFEDEIKPVSRSSSMVIKERVEPKSESPRRHSSHDDYERIDQSKVDNHSYEHLDTSRIKRPVSSDLDEQLKDVDLSNDTSTDASKVEGSGSSFSSTESSKELLDHSLSKDKTDVSRPILEETIPE